MIFFSPRNPSFVRGLVQEIKFNDTKKLEKVKSVEKEKNRTMQKHLLRCFAFDVKHAMDYYCPRVFYAVYLRRFIISITLLRF